MGLSMLVRQSTSVPFDNVVEIPPVVVADGFRTTGNIFRTEKMYCSVFYKNACYKSNNYFFFACIFVETRVYTRGFEQQNLDNTRLTRSVSYEEHDVSHV